MVGVIEKEPVSTGLSLQSFILQTKDGFSEISWWKAKLIRWLHLERFFGSVYSTDRKWIFLLENKIELAYRESIKGSTHQQKRAYLELMALSKTFYDMRKKGSNDFLDVVHQSVNDLAVVLLLRCDNKAGVPKESSLYWTYGLFRAEQLLDDLAKKKFGPSKDETAVIFEEVCERLERDFPGQESEVLSAFFSKFSGTSFAENICALRQAYQVKWKRAWSLQQVEGSLRKFLQENKGASPSDIGEWFAGTLESIKSQAPEDSRDLAHYLICLMRKQLAPWKLKESLRAYGVFVAMGLENSIINSFERAAESLKALFSENEYAHIMEGLIERKGSFYCLAIFQGIQTSDLTTDFGLFEDKARSLFSVASKDLVRGVLKVMLKRQKHQIQKESFCENVAIFFVQLCCSKKDFSAFAPLLGSEIDVPMPIASEAVSKSFKGDNSKRARSQKFIWSNSDLGSEDGQDVSADLLKIEWKVVSKMSKDPLFCEFYGAFLGNKIIDGARANKQTAYSGVILNSKRSYEAFLREKFPRDSDAILGSMQKVLDADPLVRIDELVSSQEGLASSSFASRIKGEERKSIEFCPALERIAETAIEHFISSCLQIKGQFPKRPPLSFLYQVLPNLSQSILAIEGALGLQVDGHPFFIELFKKNPHAKEILDWFEGAKTYSQESYTETFTVKEQSFPSTRPEWNGSSDEEKKLLDAWLPYYLDSQAVEKSILRSGMTSISINGLKSSEQKFSSRIVGSCVIAEDLLHAALKNHTDLESKRAIGRLLTFASIDYDPGSQIPSVLWSFLSRLEISNGIVYASPANVEPLQVKEDIVYRFGYNQEKFFVDRDMYYPLLSTGDVTEWWHVHSKQEIELDKPDEILVTFESSVLRK